MTSNFICLSFSTLRSTVVVLDGELIPSSGCLKKQYSGTTSRPRETSLPLVKILSYNFHEIKIYTTGMTVV